MKGKFGILTTVLVIFSMLWVACAPKATPTPTPLPTPTPKPTAVPATPKPKLKITVATDATWPPFEYIDETTKEFVGFDIDLMKAIAEAAGFEVEFVNVAWDPLLAGMAAGQYDAAISAMTITEERAKQFDFSEPYYNAGQLIAVRIDNDTITGPADLAGKVVGAQIGTTGAMEVEKIAGATLKTYDDISQAFLDLINGQIDAVVADNPLVGGYVGKYPDKIKSVGEPFTDEYYGIAVRKGATDILEAINKGLKIVKEQGLLEQLEDKWIKAAPKAELKITVATDATWPPFEYIDETTKEFVGFDIDLMKAIAEAAGFEVEFVNVAWDPLLAGMAAGQYDAAISAMTITEERAKQFDFSEPYYNAGQLIAVRIDNDTITGPADLAGKVVGAQIGTTGAMEVEKIAGATLKTYDDISQAFLDLINGQIDAVVADNPLVGGYVGKYPDKIKSVGEPFTDEYYGIAVRKGATDILEAINKGLKIVKEQGLLEQLEDKWIKSASSGE